MTINDIPTKYNKVTITDTTHLLSAEEFNTVVSYVKSIPVISEASDISIDAISGLNASNIQEALAALKVSAGLTDAPSDGNSYIRKDGSWILLTSDNSFYWDD